MQHRHKHHTGVLWAMILLGVGYSSLLYFLQTITGTTLYDGALGVLLGLYICSHPAAAAVDLLFARRGDVLEVTGWSGIGWVSLNVVVLLLGWVVIVIGAVHLVSQPS